MNIVPDTGSANLFRVIVAALRGAADIFHQAAILAAAPPDNLTRDIAEAVAEYEAEQEAAAAVTPAPKRGPGRPRKTPAVAPDTTPERAAGLSPQPGPTPRKPPDFIGPPVVEKPSTTAPALTYDDVRPTLIKVLEAKGEAAFVAMLAEFNVANAKLLPIDAFPAVLARAQAILAPANAMEGLL